MINLTTTLSYGLRLLANLGKERKRPKRLKKIAEEEGISLLYLRKLTAPLERAGLIKSLRGPGGGFILKRRPSQINLLEMVNALSHSRVIDCIKKPSGCRRIEDCLVKDLLQDVYNKIQLIFRGKTLEIMVKKNLKVKR